MRDLALLADQMLAKKPRAPRREKHRPPYWMKDGKVDYGLYMRSKEWFAKRKEAFEHHGDKCAICGEPATDMDHKTYKRLGHERMEDLQPLCRECHNNKHEGGAYGCVDPMTQAFADLVKSF